MRCPETRPTEGPGNEGNASPTAIDQPQYEQPQVRAKETARTPGADTPKATKAKGAGKGAPSATSSSPRTLPTAWSSHEDCTLDHSARMVATTERETGQ
ncbi:hypothetical protein V6N13_016110 [Hibiscus sabdariffa]